MRMLRIGASVFALIAMAGCATAGGSGKWISLFDGKSLKGWEQLNGTASYKVEDGTIIGRTVEGSPNSFLCSKKQFADFELEFDVMCDTGLNSGVQVRSRPKNAKDLAAEGVSAGNNKEGEIESSPGQAGYIYGEATVHKWISSEPKSDDPKVNQHSIYKNDRWNHFRVVAKGANIHTFINGVKIGDITHQEIYKTHPKGVIGLQVHGIKAGSGPYKVAWKNIRIRPID